MSTIEALGLSPETAEAVRRKAESENMTLTEYVRDLVEQHAGTTPKAARDYSYEDLLVSGAPPEPISDAVLDSVAEFRDSITGTVNTETVIASVHEERR